MAGKTEEERFMEQVVAHGTARKAVCYLLDRINALEKALKQQQSPFAQLTPKGKK